MTLKLEIPQMKMECKSVPQNRLPIVKERITPHHKSPLDEINEIRRNAAGSLW